MCSCALDDIPIVDIDPAGVFKYILLKVHDYDKRGNEENITIIRGYERHEFHSDLYDEIQEKLQPLFCEPLGGGKLVHKPHKKTIELYGRSVGYGKVDHEEAAELIQKYYPDYKIKISKEESDEEEEEEGEEEGVEACDEVKAFVCTYPSEQKVKTKSDDNFDRSKRVLS